MPAPNALLEAGADRFRADLLRLCPHADTQRIGLAVSGGADSLALLLLASSSFAVEAATVDHGLRAASADEARMVARLCADRDVPHATLAVEGAPDGNLSDWARRVRYAALAQWVDHRGLDVLLTAHHADDQLETMVMRLNRGSGVAGLAGIRPRSGNVARPLLGWRKAELEQLVTQCGFVAADDPSNRDDRFDRARLRKALAGADWLDPVAAARSAAALADAEEALDWTARAYAARRIAEREGVVSLAPEGLPAELLRRLVVIALRQISPEAAPRGAELDRLIAGLKHGRTATLAGVRCTGGTFWLFASVPPHRNFRSQ